MSLYNQESGTGRAIKPSPIALVVGLISKRANIRTMGFKAAGDSIVLVGETMAELPSDIKNQISHRARAAKKVYGMLRKKPFNLFKKEE